MKFKANKLFCLGTSSRDDVLLVYVSYFYIVCDNCQYTDKTKAISFLLKSIMKLN